VRTITASVCASYGNRTTPATDGYVVLVKRAWVSFHHPGWKPSNRAPSTVRIEAAQDVWKLKVREEEDQRRLLALLRMKSN
jgi:hypothetical protein